MTRTYWPDNSKSFKESWLIAPKLLFFCIGLVSFCMGNSISSYVVVNWGLSRPQSMASLCELVASVVGSLVFSNRADKRNIYRTTLAVCIIGFFLMTLGFGPHQMFHHQGSLPMLYRLFNSLLQFFLAGLYPVANALVLKKLASNSKNSYGRQRMFAPLGHLFVVLLIHVLQHFLQQHSLDFIIHLGLLALFSAVFLGVLFIFETEAKDSGMRGQEVGNSENVENSYSPCDESPLKHPDSIEKDEPVSVSPFKKLFTEPKFLVLFLGLLIAGVNRIFLKISWKLQVGILTENNFQGYMGKEAVYITCIAEALVYYFDENITQILGNNLMMALGHGLLILRTLGFAFMTPENINMKTFIFNSVQGIPNGLISLSAVHIASELASGATAQSIFDIPLRGLAFIFAMIIFENSWCWEVDSIRQVVSIRTICLSMSILGAIIILPIVFLDKIFPGKLSKKTSSV